MVAAGKANGGGDLEKRMAGMVDELRATFHSGEQAPGALADEMVVHWIDGGGSPCHAMPTPTTGLTRSYKWRVEQVKGMAALLQAHKK